MKHRLRSPPGRPLRPADGHVVHPRSARSPSLFSTLLALNAVRETADIESSSQDYARRFAGPVGAWLLEVQARATLDALRGFDKATILDVGGGHAQLVGPLADAGHRVTVFGSDPICGERVRPWVEAGRARFQSGDLLALPFADGAFDVVVSYRMLPHVTDVARFAGELSRVARTAVLVDYPTKRSVNAFADGLFAAKKRIEGDTRPFVVFRDSEIDSLFGTAGLRRRARHGEYFWPVALHRGLRSRSLSVALEGIASILGLRALLGSPVIARYERG